MSMIKRRVTRQIKVGGVKIGGGAPISIQSMAKIETADIRRAAAQIKRLEEAGCEIVRVAVKSEKDAEAVRAIKPKIGIPLVCDIHYDYRLAIKAIDAGADKIRLNPGNIHRAEEIEQVIKAAKKAGIPIRIGVNSGSIREGQGNGAASGLVALALGSIKLFEDMGFRDIILSLKASDVFSTVEAYRDIARRCDYPLHLGVTASGPYDYGVIKSSIGIGSLLLDGIGDTIRVSLTADPAEEVIAAKRILSSLHLRKFGPDIISCPTCGRCQVDLTGIVADLERKLSTVNCQLSTKKPVTIAVMGCEVNGPGEARVADIGIAFGKGSGMLFRDGKIIKKVRAKDAVKEIIHVIASEAKQSCF